MLCDIDREYVIFDLLHQSKLFTTKSFDKYDEVCLS